MQLITKVEIQFNCNRGALGAHFKMVLILLTVTYILSSSQAARILGIFPTPSVSHQSVFQPVWKELSLRGHNVTVITPNPLKDQSLTNLTEIDVSEAYEIQKKTDEKLGKTIENWMDVLDIALIHNLPQYEYMLEHEETKKIINGSENSFDLIIFEFTQPVFFAFRSKFKCPVVTITSAADMPHIYKYNSQVNPLDYIKGTSILERLLVSYFLWLYDNYITNRVMPIHDKVARRYFGNDIPYLEDFCKNISLTFQTRNYFVNGARSHPPNIIDVSRLNIRKNEDLPKVGTNKSIRAPIL